MLDWKKTEKEIENIFHQYSLNDIAKSLLCMSLWLPNLSSQMKNSYLTLHLIARDKSVFQNKNKITSYEDFTKLARILIDIVPSFPTTEDYFPETDWGEIKFYLQKQIFKIFYGNEITDIYDYLQMFDIKYCSVDKQFRKAIGRSPEDELRICLSLQDKIINTIAQFITEEKRMSISSGHYEVPEKSFWFAINTLDFHSQFSQIVNDEYLKNYSVSLGGENFPQDMGDFINSILYGNGASYCFLDLDEQYYLLNPRRYSCILIEKWFNLWQKNKDELFANIENNKFHASYLLGKFINQRIINDNKFEIISAVNNDCKPHESMFASAIINDDNLILFYLIDDDVANIEQEVSSVNEAIELLNQKPNTLGLHLERKNVQFFPKNTDKPLHPIVIYVYPNICIEGGISLSKIPESLNGHYFDMTSFLGIFDEVENLDEFLGFCDYLKKDTTPIMRLANLMDRYAAYKDSHKIISEGAIEFTKVFLDPHWGEQYKYEKLKKFWSSYPDRNYFDHPRSWVPEVTGKSVRLVARGYIGCAFYSKIDDANIFITAPFSKMNLEEARITDLQLMCLEDYIANTADILRDLEVLKTFKDVNVTVIPDTLISRNDGFQHLKKDIENLDLRNGSVGIVKNNVVVIRIVFNVEKTIQLFLEPSNNKYEVNFFSFVLNLFNQIRMDSNLRHIVEQINSRFEGRKPRHVMMSIDTGVCFNEETTSAILPEQHAYKTARKKVAEIVKGLNISPGEYELDAAKEIINQIREKFVEEIDEYVLKYDFSSSIKILITNIDSLIHKVQTELSIIEKSVEHEVDYDRAEKFNKVHTEYLSGHRDYRYIIEKFVQHSKAGSKTLADQDIQYLLAFANELGHLYNTSNVIHYGLYSVGLSISDRYVFKALENEKIDEKNEKYGKILAVHQIYEEDSQDKSIDTKDERRDYQLKLDEVFVQEKGFKITNFLDVCVVMSNYPTYDNKIANSSYYVASKDEILPVIKSVIKDCEENEIIKIFDILTLKKDKMLTIVGDVNIAKDLPVWENNKRPYRYTVKPIIELDENSFIWGPYSIKKVLNNWIKQLMDGSIPYDLQNQKIECVISQRKDDIGRKVENKAYEILQRHTPFVEKNVYLDKRDKQGKHPSSLGDYDVLVYIKAKNIVLNVECKDLLGAYCIKDAKRLRDQLFGEPKEKNYISKVIRREGYLVKNLKEIFLILNWECLDIKKVKVVSVFTVRHLFWWHLFPEYETNVEFVKLSKLDDFVKEKCS